MKPDVSVIVVNLNRRDLLGRCLESLWRQTFANFEVGKRIDGRLARVPSKPSRAAAANRAAAGQQGIRFAR